MNGAQPGDLLVLALFWGGVCLVFALVGAVVDEGGLYDRWVAMHARRRRRLTRTFSTVAATAAFTLALPAFALPRAEVGTAGTSGRVSATNSDVPPYLVGADTSAPAPADVPLHTRAGVGIDPVADGGDVPSAAEHSVWDRLAECESHGEWDYNPATAEWGTRLYEGGLQFHPDTWDAHKPDGFPPTAYLATREQQIAVAESVLAAQGWGAWPACAKRLGLR